MQPFTPDASVRLAMSVAFAAKTWCWNDRIAAVATYRSLSCALLRGAPLRLADTGGDAADPRQDASAFPVCRRRRRPGQRRLADARSPAPRVSVSRDSDRND